MLIQHFQHLPMICTVHAVYHQLLTSVSSMYVFTGVVVFLFSCREGHLDLVKYMIERCGCDAGIKSNNGGTPLHWACE